MRRIDRLDLLTRIVRDRPGITTGDLALALDVSVRSVFRDFDHLRERGVPIEAERGRGGGVRLHPSYGLGRVLFSTEEALCTLLTLAVAEKLGFPMFADELQRARRKIVDVFPQGERRRLAPLRERVLIGKTASAAVRTAYGVPNRVATRALQAAFVREALVNVVYTKETGERSSRRLEPHALLINFPAWYLLAVDLGRGEPRTFRFDRFESVTAIAETFRPRPKQIAESILDPTLNIPMDQI